MEKSIYSSDYKKFQKKLKLARIDAEMRQEDVAKKLKVQQSLISRMEAGQRRIDVVELKRFAELYKKPIEYFLNWD